MSAVRTALALLSATRQDRAGATNASPASSWQARPLTTIANTAELLCLSKSGVRQLLDRQQLVGVRVGKRRLVKTSSIVQMIDESTEQAS